MIINIHKICKFKGLNYVEMHNRKNEHPLHISKELKLTPLSDLLRTHIWGNIYLSENFEMVNKFW